MTISEIVADIHTVATHVWDTPYNPNDPPDYGPPNAIGHKTAARVLHTADVAALEKLLSWVGFMETLRARHPTSWANTEKEQRAYAAANRLRTVLCTVHDNRQEIAKLLAA
jgi:hypothetical protein